MHRIIVQLAFDRRGNRQHGKFVVAILEDRRLRVSRQPLLDCARILIAEGADPKTPIATRHAGAAHDALISTVCGAALWTVRENENQSPTFVRWNAFPRDAVQSPVRFSGAPLPDTSQPAERIHRAAT